MFAQCPACLTVFEINAAALVAAHGRVRCGECGDVFDTLRTLTDRLPAHRDDRLETLPMRFVPPEATQMVTRAAEAHVLDTATLADGTPKASPILLLESPIDAQSGGAAIESMHTPPPFDETQATIEVAQLTDVPDRPSLGDTVAADVGEDTVSRASVAGVDASNDGASDGGQRDDLRSAEPALAFATAFAARDAGEPKFGPIDSKYDPHDLGDIVAAEQTQPTFLRTAAAPPARNAGWLMLAGVFALVLVGEIAWAERARWIDNASARAWLDPLCSILHCKLPLRHDIDRLRLLSRDVRPHPSVPGALIISATLRNDAAFAQAFPLVAITLSDLDENRVAMRRFKPQQYLPDVDAAAHGIGAGATTTLAFEVADPGKSAIAFEFKFER